MKRIIYILIFLTSLGSLAQPADSLFTKANKLYQQEKYDDALTIYQEIEANKLQSDDLFYNMANAYYKKNQVAPAVYYYEKALLLNPNHEDAKHNLQFAKRMALDNIEALPKSVGQKLSETVVQRLTYDTWAYLAIVFSFLFAILFLMYHFSYTTSKKRVYFITGILSALLAIIAVIFAYSNHEFTKNYKTAIVFAQQSNVRSAPTKSSEVNFELHEGTKVQLLESLDGFKKIKIADGKVGWIEEEDIKELQ